MGRIVFAQTEWAELHLPRQHGQNFVGQDSHVPYVGSILNGQKCICQDRMGRIVFAKTEWAELCWPRQPRTLCGLYFEWAELYLPRQNGLNCIGQDSHVPYVGFILNGQNCICQRRWQNCIGQDSHVPYVGSILNGKGQTGCLSRFCLGPLGVTVNPWFYI